MGPTVKLELINSILKPWGIGHELEELVVLYVQDIGFGSWIMLSAAADELEKSNADYTLYLGPGSRALMLL